MGILRVNRQQEIQRICSTLLSTTQDKRVKAAFILGSQANRDTKSSDSLNLHNMKDAGDIEQDANLVLGVWNPSAEEMLQLKHAIDRAEAKLRAKTTFTNELNVFVIEDNSKLGELNTEQLKSTIKKAQGKLHELADSNDRKLIIKILKNRNGKKDLDISLNTRLSQFLVYEGEEK